VSIRQLFSHQHIFFYQEKRKRGGINDWQLNNKLKFTFQHHDLKLKSFSNDVKETVI